MATFEEEQEQRKQLDARLAELAQITAESLVRQDLGAELNFEAGLPYFERTLKLFRDLKNCSLDGLPLSGLQQLVSAATQALDPFKKIEAFSLAQYSQNPTQSRDQLIAQVRDQYDAHYKQITPHIAYSVRKGTDFEALEREARRTLEEVRRVQVEQLSTQKAFATEAEQIVETMRRAAAEVGVAQHAIYFKNEAEEDARGSVRWFWATVGASALTILFGGFAIWFYSTHALTMEPAQAAQLAIAKLAVFSVLYFGILWTSRTYRALRHNCTINRHRQNALSTFETFVKAATDDQTKNAVLLYAAQAIFAPQITGYISKDAEPQSASHVVEILRGALARETH
jgi:hypothetical protein